VRCEIDQIEVRAVESRRSGEANFIDVFFVHFNAYFACSVFAASAEADFGEVGT